jgi:hypothetical protein
MSRFAQFLGYQPTLPNINSTGWERAAYRSEGVAEALEYLWMWLRVQRDEIRNESLGSHLPIEETDTVLQWKRKGYYERLRALVSILLQMCLYF